MSGKRYTEEFKLEAVKQVTERGRKAPEVARTLGRSQMSMLTRILAGTLVLWASQVSAGAQIGQEPPADYIGIDQRKEHIRFSHHKGRVVVATFWASWCGPCLREMPILEKVQKAAGDRMRVVGINFHEPFERYRRVMEILETSPISLVHDDGRLAERFGVKSLPHIFLINKAGRIAHVHNGYDEARLPEFLDEINALLLEPYEPPAAQ